MVDDPKVYGVIVESKDEGPMIMEGFLATYDQAHARMRSIAARPNVIRVAMFKAVYSTGNNALIPQESQP
jgi:hypothetical protein